MSTSADDSALVVCVDGSPASDAAVRWAAREAVICNAPITLTHVIAPALTTTRDEALRARVERWQRYRARHVVDKAREIIADGGGDGNTPEVRTELCVSNPVPALVDASKDARVVVVGSRGMGAFRRRVLGSVSSGLIPRAHCPVAVVHEQRDPPTTGDNAPILLGIDGSPASELATAIAFGEASRRGVGLVALHAWSDVGVFPILSMDCKMYRDEGQEVLAERLAGWQEHYPEVHVRRRLVCDQPARWLVKESQHAQLVVVGSHGRGRFAGMSLGSVGTVWPRPRACRSSSPGCHSVAKRSS
jgi:nucleotide-binding universal stress UspA family protein